MTEREIQDEMVRIRTADPSLDLASANEKFAELHPELFITEAELVAQNKSLIQPETGVWKAPMIGSTTLEPAEERFSHA